MKKSILLLFIAAMAMGAIARSVSSEMAIAAANAWAAKNAAFGVGAQATGEVRSERDPKNAGVVLWHQVSMQGGGMLVVAPVTEIEPVVMALESDPGVLDEGHPLRALLTNDMRRRLQFLGQYSAVPAGGAMLQGVALAVPAISEDAKAWGEACNAKWAKLTGGSLQEAAGVGVLEIAVEACTVKGFEKGGALTHWNQGDYNGKHLYNYYTPNNAVCGCVATACSALAQFFGTTNAVSGIVGENCTYRDQPYRNLTGKDAVTIGGPIDWSILPENWGGTNAPSKELTSEQQELIGRVAFDAGVGLNMMWEVGDGSGSGAYTADIANVLKTVFGFKNARTVSLGEDASQYEKIIYNQCRAGAPVGMGIDGHAVVACGYGLDADGVERVRVFMGWAGAGDGWYALPKIDTKATMNGGTYLSEVVSCAITMISYADDDIVPIVGHVSMPGAKLELPALERAIDSNDYGYFGTRVPAEAGSVEVTCQGKSAQLDIGEAAAESMDAEELCGEGVLPDAFEFVLLNASVAYSLERAKLMALKEGKAILRVSGASGDTNTAAVLDHIYRLDEENVNGFSDKFVYYFSGSKSSSGDGADVSFGVYLPQDVDPEKRWQASNGALAYGYSVTLSTQTNVTHDASHAAETNDLGQIVTTRNFTYTFAPIDADPVVSTNDVEDVDAILAAIIKSLDDVIDIGGTRYVESTSGITVTIAATSPEAEAAIDSIALPRDKCGLHEKIYAPGSRTFVCDAVVTNEAAGLVMGCAGWSITNATTGVVSSGTGAEAKVDLATNDVLTLTWDFSKIVAVKVTVAWADPEALNDPEPVMPGTGWYAYGEPVVFSAKESVGNYGFVRWKGAENKDLPEGCAVLSPTKILVPMVEAGSLYAYYRRGATVQPVESSILSVKATSWFLNGSLTFDKAPADRAPQTSVFGSEGELKLASDASAEVKVVGSAYVRADATEYIDEGGNKWILYGFVAEEMTGEEDAVALQAKASPDRAFSVKATEEPVFVNWLWIPDVNDPETEFTIVWDDALSTLNAHGYSTNLCTVAELEAHGISVSNIKVTAPKGFKAKVDTVDGNVVASLELDEEVLQPVAADGVSSPLTILANGDGTVTVKADVANGVRGFWYSLYATDELGGSWSLVASGYKDGTPSVQATEDDRTVSLSIVVEPTDAKKFYKLVVTDVNPELPAAP